MATSEGIPSSIDIEFLELNDNPYLMQKKLPRFRYERGRLSHDESYFGWFKAVANQNA